MPARQPRRGAARTRAPAHEGGDRPATARGFSLPFDVFAVNQRLATFLGDALAATGVRPAEYAVYSAIFEGGPTTPTQLARLLGMPMSTLSTHLAEVFARGHATRLPNPADGRSFLVVLNDAGRAVMRRAGPAFGRAVARLEADLDTPVEDVRQALAEVNAALARALGERAG